MAIVAFSYQNKDSTQLNYPEVSLDGNLMSLENETNKQLILSAITDRNSVLVSCSKQYNALDFATHLNLPIDEVRAKKVDLYDLQRALQTGDDHKDPAIGFFERDKKSAEFRKDFSEELLVKINNYHPGDDFRLNDDQKQTAQQLKMNLVQDGQKMLTLANAANNHLDNISDSHVLMTHHCFKRFSQITPEKVFNEHVAMINMSNEAQYGENLFELDFKQAKDVLNTLQSNLNNKMVSIADKYFGLKDGVLDTSKNNEFTYLAMNHFPDLMDMGKDIPDAKALSRSDSMAALFATKMPDGTSLINPAWFNELKQSGIAFDISEIYKESSVCARHLMNMQKPIGMNPKDEFRLDFVVDMLDARRAYLDFDKNRKDLDKLIAISEDHNGKVPLQTKYAGTLSKRFSSSNDYNLNALGMQDYSKSVLKAPNDGVIIDVDYSQAELAMTAAILNNKQILQAYHDKTDIYLALGIQAKNVTQGSPAPWPVLMQQTTQLQNNTPNEVKNDKNSDYYAMRSAGKMVVIPAIYGIKESSLAKDQGISEQQAKTLLQAFDSIFPEIKQTQFLLQDYLKQTTGNVNPQILQFGGVDGKMITINSNDKEWVDSYSPINPYDDFVKNKNDKHLWILKNIGIDRKPDEVSNETVMTVSLASGEKMAYINPYLNKTDKGMSVNFHQRNGKEKSLSGYSFLQNIAQFTTFSAVREMTVNTSKSLENHGIDSKYLLNIHDSTAFLAKNQQEADKTLQVLKTGVMNTSSIAPNVAMSYTQNVSDSLTKVDNLTAYQEKTLSFDDNNMDMGFDFSGKNQGQDRDFINPLEKGVNLSFENIYQNSNLHINTPQHDNNSLDLDM